ncbi:MAG TPA: hypothetical protein ENK91_04735 [Bacteroidetes bacterium]|nr:hypothetical protein [Bacteroidota bacterium]
MRFIYLIVFLFSISFAHSQDYYRFKSDFVIKSKTPEGKQQLTVGKVYYDKNIKKIIFDITFPEKEIWVQKDTTLYKIVNNSIVEEQNTPNIAEFTIYHLILNGNLTDYGLKNTKFKITDVEKAGKSIISTWEPPEELKDKIGPILMQNTNQQLTGIVFKNPEGEIISRQFIRNYLQIKGLSVPQEIINEVHIEGKKYYEITDFSNTVINEFTDEEKYDYKIP